MREAQLILAIGVLIGFLGCEAEQTVNTEVTLAVDNANFSGSCPHDYQFNGVIVADLAPTTVRYFWERSTGNSSTFSVSLPTAGGIIVTDTLTVVSSGTATVKLHLTQPEDKVSNEVTITTMCQ
jgi:hypothetical protein